MEITLGDIISWVVTIFCAIAIATFISVKIKVEINRIGNTEKYEVYQKNITAGHDVAGRDT